MKRLELVTDLTAICDNAREIRRRVDTSAALLCVVKADAYGHGALQVARALENQKLADAFAVVTPAEGEKLVKEGSLTKPVVVLGLPCGEEDAALSVENGLHQAIESVSEAEMLDRAAAKRGMRAKVHIKLDTGMHRIGVSSEPQLDALLSALKTFKNVDVTGLFTHFCAADEDEAFTLEQKERFERMRAAVRKAGFIPVCHAAASTAMLKSGFAYDMVRAGIALYGTGVKELKGVVRPAQTLLSGVISLRRIAKGETVGYSRRFTAPRDSLIATVPCGYGDGYPRILSGRADVLIEGKRAPIEGNVCMDMLMADVSDIPDVKKGSPVVLLGKMGQEVITPDELAEKAGTIPYEIMLGFSGRVQRSWIKLQEG